MEKFTNLKSIPSYLSLQNIDTDMIIPKQFLKTIKRTGLGKSLFYEMRYDENGKVIEDFILNKEPYNKSRILLAGKNFGCGSSREHAPWALSDFGIKCVISSSFADIFYNNCFKNGILPIKIEEQTVVELSEYSKRKEEIEIDLEKHQLVQFLRNRLKAKIELVLTTDKTIDKKLTYTNKDKYNLLKEKNPLIEELKNTFKLSI